MRLCFLLAHGNKEFYMKIEKLEFDGNEIKNAMDFHKQLARALDIEEFYGHNLYALRDILTSDLVGTLIWKNSETSKRNMGKAFEEIIAEFEYAQQECERIGWENSFTYQLD